MTLHPNSPPGVFSYLVIVTIVGLLSFIVFWRTKNQFSIFIAGVGAFIPFIIGATWLYWNITLFGSSGYVGVQDPREIFGAIIQSFWYGVGASAVLVVFNGLIAATTSFKITG